MSDPATRLHRAVEKFIKVIEEGPPDSPAPGAWGSREVLLHIVFWHETDANVVTATLNQEEPDVPSGSYRAINARAVEMNAGVSVGQLIERLRAAQTRLETLAACEAAHALQIRTTAGSRPKSMNQVLASAEAHIRVHRLELSRQQRGPQAGADNA